MLSEVLHAAVYVAANVIDVVLFHLSGCPYAAGKNPLLKTRRETLDLRFNLAVHVRCRTVRDVAIRPGCVFAYRR